MAINYLIPGGGVVSDEDSGVAYLLPGSGVYGFAGATGPPTAAIFGNLTDAISSGEKAQTAAQLNGLLI